MCMTNKHYVSQLFQLYYASSLRKLPDCESEFLCTAEGYMPCFFPLFRVKISPTSWMMGLSILRALSAVGKAIPVSVWF